MQPRPAEPELADGRAGHDERRRRHRAGDRAAGSVREVVRQLRVHGRPRHRRVRVDERGADLDQRRRAGRGAVGHRRSPTTCSTRCIGPCARPTTCSPGRTRSPTSSSRARAADCGRWPIALKAEALGEALQSYQKIPIKTYRRHGADLRAARRGAAVRACAARLGGGGRSPTTPPSAFFNSNILTPGVNLTNMIQLFRARYARMANDDATALAAANLVGAHRAGGAVGADVPVAGGQLLRERHRRHERHRAAASVADVDGCRRISASRTS